MTKKYNLKKITKTKIAKIISINVSTLHRYGNAEDGKKVLHDFLWKNRKKLIKFAEKQEKKLALKE